MNKIDGLQDLKKKEKVALNLLKSDLKRVYFVLKKFDDLVKSPFCPIFVIPAKAGIQGFL